MARTTAISPSSDDPGLPPKPRSPKPVTDTAPKRPEADPLEADVRLLIQLQGDLGPYVYIVVDRSTGKVLAELPSSDVLRLMSKDAYAPGTLIKTKA